MRRESKLWADNIVNTTDNAKARLAGPGVTVATALN